MIAAATGRQLGGLLGERFGLGATIMVCVGGDLLPFLWLWYSPIRGLRNLPQPAEPQ